VFTKGKKLGRKTPSEYRGVIYQTKEKGMIYMPVQSYGSSNSELQDLTSEAIIPKHGVTVVV
jgi:hypothetical protein